MLLVTTPGAWVIMAQGSRALGTVLISSCVNVKATFVSPVSMIGASPVTVTVSLMAAGASWASMVYVVPAWTRMSGYTLVPKPDRSKATLYTPIGMLTRR